MYQKQLNFKADIIRWKRFCRKGFAVFASLGKEITISTLSVATLAFVVPTTAQAQTSMDNVRSEEVFESDTLPEFLVTAAKLPLPLQQAARSVSVITREQIQDAPVNSVNDLLKFIATVDVRQRGPLGIQTDISVNGGTHDQIVILINGVNISSPQTGHLSADLPLSVNDIQRIEILEGAASRVYGTSAFSGAINIITKENTGFQDLGKPFSASMMLGAGSYGTFSSGLSCNLKSQNLFNHLSAEAVRSDGGTPNSQFEKYNLFYNGGAEFDRANVKWQLANSNMNYGANTFYSGKYPNQFEQNRRIMGAVSISTKGKIKLMPTIYFNRNYDHYQLIRHSDIGENYHLTDVYGATVNSSLDWAAGTTLIGADFRNEGILSTALGKPLQEEQYVRIQGKNGYYTKKDNRTNISYFFEHDFVWRFCTISAGFMANMNSSLDYRYRLYPGIDVAVRPDNYWKLAASWNMAQRMPTFTDLYYKSPTQEGNVGLKPEKTSEFAISAAFNKSGFNLCIKAFYRHQNNMIDWIMTDADSVNNYTTYHATNFKVNNWGVNFNALLSFPQMFGKRTIFNYLSLNYAFLKQKRLDDIPVYASSYALDYLRHKLVLTLNAKFLRNFEAEVSCRAQDRMGEYVKYTPKIHEDGNTIYEANTCEYKPYAIVNLKIKWIKQKYELFAIIDNLNDKSYYDIGNVPQPGIWITAGAKINF